MIENNFRAKPLYFSNEILFHCGPGGDLEEGGGEGGGGNP